MKMNVYRGLTAPGVILSPLQAGHSFNPAHEAGH